MAFDPTQSLNNYTVYQSGQNDTDNRTNQNNQPAGRLQLPNQYHPPKARVCNNNQNSDTAKSKKFRFGKLARQTFRKIAHSQKDKNKLFIEAAKNGDAKWAKKWLDAGADVDVNQVDNDGQTPLHRAAKEGHIDVVDALLLHPGADVNKADDEGWTPLNWAAEEGHTDVVNALLSHPGIDVNQANDNGWTPVYRAARNGHIEVVKLLLSHPNSCDKIEVNKADDEGWTPLNWAAEEGHTDVVNALLSHPGI
ncbi:MAG: hypothetical protein GY874_06250, partial [Desulfobacteraceae bacterium]|nr:hypothetical protein [Desulfobacteraceae bacterium]